MNSSFDIRILIVIIEFFFYLDCILIVIVEF